MERNQERYTRQILATEEWQDMLFFGLAKVIFLNDGTKSSYDDQIKKIHLENAQNR